MPDVKMLVSAITDVGRARTTNEDACVVMDVASGDQIAALGADQLVDVNERGVLLALSDGMGGHQAGEVASALVLESLQAALQDQTKQPIQEQLESAVLRANSTVLNAARTDKRHGMGATLTAVFVRGGEAYIAEVGDSRAYLLRQGRLRQITRDQSMIQLLVDHGVLSADEAKHSPSKNVILQAVGLSRDIRVAIARLELRRGDRFLLCSDGVTNAVNDEELRQILTNSEPRAACATMIALANERGGDDNQTAIVADLTGEALEAAQEFETVTSTYEVLQAFEAPLDRSGATAAAAPAATPPAVAAAAATTTAPGPESAESTMKLPRAKKSAVGRIALLLIVGTAVLIAALLATTYL
jgi:PPM family protein phosphatase